MRCKTCKRLGHTAKHCKNQAMCSNCNLSPHSGDHAASSPLCPKFQEQKEKLKIKTRKRCSMREARTLHKQQIPFNNTLSYSTIAAKGQNITNVKTKELDKTNRSDITYTHTAALGESPSTSSSMRALQKPLPNLNISHTISSTNEKNTLNTKNHNNSSHSSSHSAKYIAQTILTNSN